jgi:hypothetical protein
MNSGILPGGARRSGALVTVQSRANVFGSRGAALVAFKLLALQLLQVRRLRE